MPLVSITRLRLRSSRYILPFLYYTVRIHQQAKKANGNVGVSLLRERGNVYWTRTLWTTEDAMKAFVLAGPHAKVMRRLLEWCDEAAVVRWVHDTGHEPEWHEAHRRLQHEGRRSKVNHPSAAHQRYEIPEPKLRK